MNLSHSTGIFRQYYEKSSWKYCKIAKIVRNLSLILLKYCNNFATSTQNMTYVRNIAKTSKCINNVFFNKLDPKLSLDFQISTIKYKKKNISGEFHIFVIFFAITRIRIDLST